MARRATAWVLIILAVLLLLGSYIWFFVNISGKPPQFSIWPFVLHSLAVVLLIVGIILLCSSGSCGNKTEIKTQ